MNTTEKAISKKAILKQANVELTLAVEDLSEQVKQLTKQIENEKSCAKYLYETVNKLGAEIEDVHSLLDSLPNAPKRIRERKDGEWQDYKYTIITRLASWLASRGAA